MVLLGFEISSPCGRKGGSEQKNLCQPHIFDYQTFWRKKLAEKIASLWHIKAVFPQLKMTSCTVLGKNALDSERSAVFFIWKQHPCTLMRRKRAADLCTPEKSPGIQGQFLLAATSHVLPGKEIIFNNGDKTGWITEASLKITSTCIWFLQHCFTSGAYR